MRTFAQKPEVPQHITATKPATSDRAHLWQSRDVNSAASTRFAYDFARVSVYAKSPIGLQSKLTVNRPGDQCEQEADRVADKVMNIPEALSAVTAMSTSAPVYPSSAIQLHRTETINPFIQRQPGISAKPKAQTVKDEYNKAELSYYNTIGLVDRVIPSPDPSQPTRSPQPPPEPEEGRAFEIGWIVRNTGWKTAPEHQNTLTIYDAKYCAGCRRPEDEVYRIEQSAPSIISVAQLGKEPGKDEYQETFTIGGLQAGHYEIVAELDSKKEVDEINEDNNVQFMMLNVRPGNKPKPDTGEEEEETVQRKTDAGLTPDAGQDVESEISAIRGGGQPLPQSVRDFFEQRFGYDFSRVRVHTDAKAAESSNALNALAYTVGEHIAFAPNRYDHATYAGRRLLAHELAHVVQQREGAIALQRQPQQGGAEELSRDLFEISEELRQLEDKIAQVSGDVEIVRHQLFLAGKQIPNLADRIDPATVASFVEALIETSQTLAPFISGRKRGSTSVAKGLTIHKFRAQFESALEGKSPRGKPSIGQPKSTKIVKGFYDRATDSIHLTTDSRGGTDSKFGDALHEGIHKYSLPHLRNSLGNYINEGFTQHFADRVSAEHGLGIYKGHSYGPEMACAEKVMRWLNERTDGEKLAGGAYFRPDVEPLRQEIMRRLRINDSQLKDLAQDRNGEALCERIMNAP
jgi:Domain of unknown function (DUF4157)